MDEADILVRDQRFDLERTLGGDHRHQGLGRRHDPTDGVDRQLLHNTVDRRGQGLEPRPLLGLHELLDETVSLLLRLSEVGEQRAAKLRLGLTPLFGDPASAAPASVRWSLCTTSSRSLSRTCCCSAR
jgi:hypothetical protein